MDLDKLEAAREAAQRPGETFHAGAEFDALVREYVAELIAAARDNEEMAGRIIQLEREKQLLIDEGDMILRSLQQTQKDQDVAMEYTAKLERELIATRIDRMTAQERVAKLEEAIQEFADDFPGYSPMWESVRQFARRALK